MKKIMTVFALVVSVVYANRSADFASEPFWDTSGCENPVVSTQSAVSPDNVSGFSRLSAWDDMVEVFSTFIRGLSIRVR